MIWPAMRERKRESATMRTGWCFSTDRYDGAGSDPAVAWSSVVSVKNVIPDQQWHTLSRIVPHHLLENRGRRCFYH